jgi:hypothetical protein
VSTLEQRRRLKRKSQVLVTQKNTVDNNSRKIDSPNQKSVSQPKTFSNLKNELEEITKPLKKITPNFNKQDEKQESKKGILKVNNKIESKIAK